MQNAEMLVLTVGSFLGVWIEQCDYYFFDTLDQSATVTAHLLTCSANRSIHHYC